MTKNKKHAWIKAYKLELSIAVVGLIAINLIFLPEAFRATNTVNPQGAAQLGDFVGGYVGTFFALLSVVLLTKTLKSQQESASFLNFETKYFELLRLHRENVVELEVQGISSRKLFVVLVREFRSIHEIVAEVSKNHSLHFSQLELIQISYHCLFFGTGPNSTRMLQSYLEHKDEFVSTLINTLDNEHIKTKVQKEKRFAYVPFEGHQSRLGHYYRHLYQAIRYVDDQEIDADKKYEYVKTIRAQLSNHEQALLLLNSISPMGANWWKFGFLIKYKLVQNLPKNFFNPKDELDTNLLFPPRYFEWEEPAEDISRFIRT